MDFVNSCSMASLTNSRQGLMTLSTFVGALSVIFFCVGTGIVCENDLRTLTPKGPLINQSHHRACLSLYASLSTYRHGILDR